jgi:hypothetical protein
MGASLYSIVIYKISKALSSGTSEDLMVEEIETSESEEDKYY